MSDSSDPSGPADATDDGAFQPLGPRLGPRPPRRRTREWPNGAPGNHRRGAVRGTRSGRRRGTLPRHKDPIILKRRAIAAPLWERGYAGRDIQRAVNAWLVQNDELPVSMKTIYKDHLDIVADWQRSYEVSIETSRTGHVAALKRLATKAWADYEKAGDGRSKAALINAIRSLEEATGKFDGSLTSSPQVQVNVPIIQIDELDMSVFSDDELRAIIRRARGEEGA